jgi:manganese-dependent inorganic pyrophosphatase
MHSARENGGHAIYALMVTDIVAKGTKLLVSGNAAPLERTFEANERDGVIDLPGVMSRKKQVAPKLMTAL